MQQFDGDEFAGLMIACSIDLSHGASADAALELESLGGVGSEHGIEPTRKARGSG
jgi:hypothetical protein